MHCNIDGLGICLNLVLPCLMSSLAKEVQALVKGIRILDGAGQAAYYFCVSWFSSPTRKLSSWFNK